MRLLALWRWLFGFVQVRIEGRGVERLVNLLVAAGIPVWDVRRFEGFTRANISVAGFKRIRPLVRKSRCRIRIERKVGLRFAWLRLNNRRALVLGSLAFLISLYLFTSFVWVVKVVGARSIDPHYVLEVAARYGLTPGGKKRGLDLREIERSIVLEIHGLSWARIRSQGTVYTIEIIENIEKPFGAQEGPCDIVATKSGTIMNMLVLMGSAVVREGERVNRGQMLIAAEPTVGDTSGKLLHARGTIKARVTYLAAREVCLERIVGVWTGKAQRALGIKIGQVQTIWRPPFGRFEHESVEPTVLVSWPGRNARPIVELHQLTYYELKPQTLLMSHAEAVDSARTELEQALRLALSEGAEIESVDATVSVLPGCAVLRLVCSVVEEIGEPRPFATR